MADEESRAAHAKLLRQIRAMQRELARAQAEAHTVRDRVAAERKKYHDVRTERRAVGRFNRTSADAEFEQYRRRKKR